MMRKMLSILVVAFTTIIQYVYSTDVDILQYALILENLEAAFYAKGVQQFSNADFQNAGLNGAYSQFQLLAKEEADHVTFLSTALKSVNATPLAACNYSFNFQTVPQFVATARALEAVGVSAYIGAINQISNGAYTTAAATITTIEARHQAYLDIISGASGFPQSFDTPLAANFVVTLAGAFIKSCPFALPKASPALSITSSGAAGSTIYLNNLNNTKNLYCSFLFGQQQTWSKIYTSGKNVYCKAPQAAAAGIIYAFVTSDNKTQITLSNASSVLYGPAIFTVTNNSTSNNGATNTGASNTGASNTGASNTGASNTGASNTGASNYGATNNGANSNGYTYTIPSNGNTFAYPQGGIAPITYTNHALRKSQN